MQFKNFNFKLAVIAVLQEKYNYPMPEFTSVNELLKYCKDIEIIQKDIDRIKNFAIHNETPLYKKIENKTNFGEIIINSIEDIFLLRRLTRVAITCYAKQQSLDLEPLLQIENLSIIYISDNYIANTENNKQIVEKLKKRAFFSNDTEQDLVQNQQLKDLRNVLKDNINSENAREQLTVYTELLKLYPTNVDYLNSYGRCLSKLKKYNEALDWFEHCIKTCEDFYDINKYLLYYNKMEILGYYLNRADEAIKSGLEVTKENPDFFYPYHDIACFYVFKNEIDKALEYLAKSLEIGEEDALQRAVEEIDFKGIQKIQQFLVKEKDKQDSPEILEDFVLSFISKSRKYKGLPLDLAVWTNKVFLLFEENKLVCIDLYAVNELYKIKLPTEVAFKSIVTNDENIFAIGYNNKKYFVSAYNCNNRKLLWNIELPVEIDYFHHIKSVTDNDFLFVFIEKYVIKINIKTSEIVKQVTLSAPIDDKTVYKSDKIFFKASGCLAYLTKDLEFNELTNIWCDFSIENDLLYLLNSSLMVEIYNLSDLSLKDSFVYSEFEMSETPEAIRAIHGKPDYCIFKLSNTYFISLVNLKSRKQIWHIQLDANYFYEDTWQAADIIAGESGCVLKIYTVATDDEAGLFISYKTGLAGYHFADGFSKYVMLGDRILQLRNNEANLFSISEGEPTLIQYFYPKYPNLSDDKIIFEEANFLEDTEFLVLTELETGCYSNSNYYVRGNWFDRIMNSNLALQIKKQVQIILNLALNDSNPNIRCAAISELETNKRMRIERIITEIITTYFWDKFAGLRYSHEDKTKDRGGDALQLLAEIINTNRDAMEFIKKMAFDKIYGFRVLASLSYYAPDWVIENITELITNELDPNGLRLEIILFNLRFSETNKERNILSVFRKLKRKKLDLQISNAINLYKNQEIYDKIFAIIKPK